jgi:hypothetical protein
MKQIGKKKVAKGTLPAISSRPKASTRPHGSSTQPADKKYRYTPTNVEDMAPVLVPKAPKGPRADSGTFPPKAKKGEVLVGSKEPTEVPTFTSTGKGRQFSQPVLPGTGVPKPVVEQVSPAKYQRLEGPLSKNQTEKIGQKASTASKPWTEEDLAPKVKVANEVNKISGYTPTDRNWKPESNRGQQFAMDTTEMTGAQEVKSIASQGGLASQKSAGKELTVRPGGKSKAKRDRAAAPKPMEQPSLFPDFEVKEGRSNAFYMAGTVKPISEASKNLQGSAAKPFGRQPNSKDFEGEESADSVLDRLKVNPKKKAD